MPTYYSCDGSVSVVGNGNNQGLKCSTGWQTYTPPTTQTNTLELTGQFITYEQGQALMSGLILLFMTILVFKKLATIK